jgi:hypothetical protein
MKQTNNYIAYCGLYCGACAVLQANLAGKLNAVAKKWKMKPSDISCHGCKSNVLSIYCKDCDIRKCARENKVEFCGECKKFPCQRIKDFANDGAPHHAVVISNLKRLKEIGENAWLKEQEKQWTCECGAKKSWYLVKCPKCGKQHNKTNTC